MDKFVHDSLQGEKNKKKKIVIFSTFSLRQCQYKHNKQA